MYWNEDSEEKAKFTVPDNVIDIVFAVTECKCLPSEHAHALAEALHTALPWLKDETQVGIHPIYGAESGNGWQRPDDPDELIYISRRQKMTLRIPKYRLDDARQLTGQTLDIAGYHLVVGEASTRLLSDLPTLFARNVVTEQGIDENEFLQQMLAQLNNLGIPVKKMLASMERMIRTPYGPIYTRGLMLADLLPEDSVRLQEEGLGPHRHLGCGLFVPQKGIKAVNPK